jgi:hypothetical protein
MNRNDAKQRNTMNEIPQVTLFFKDVVLHFAGTAEQILAKQYDFTQFGPIIAIEGNDLGPTDIKDLWLSFSGNALVQKIQN